MCIITSLLLNKRDSYLLNNLLLLMPKIVDRIKESCTYIILRKKILASLIILFNPFASNILIDKAKTISLKKSS